MWWYIMVALTCAPMNTDDFKHFFHMLVGHLCIFSEVIVQIFCQLCFYWALFAFLKLSCQFFVYSGYRSFIRSVFCKHFFPFCRLSFCFLNSIIWRAVVSFDEAQFINYLFYTLCYLRNHCLIQNYSIFVFSSRNFILSGFMFRFMNCLKVIFVYCEWSIVFFFVVFNWSIVDLQCCANLYCTAKWLTYKNTFFFVCFSIMVYHRLLNIVPCGIQ